MYEDYLQFAKILAFDAGKIMRELFMNSDREWKEDATPVTIADIQINDLVIQRVNETFPDHSTLGEEASDIKVDSKFTWVCDPVDGTMPYSHGLPISTFSLALCENGIPKVGVVYDPFVDRLFYASVSGGAFCNNEKIHVNDSTFQNALIDLEGFPSTKPILNLNSAFNDQLIKKGAQTTCLWSAILPSCLVASGNFTAVLFNVWKPEDGAAIKVIIEEAGGRVTDLYGNDQRYDQKVKGFIASNGIVHDEIVKMIQEASSEV